MALHGKGIVGLAALGVVASVLLILAPDTDPGISQPAHNPASVAIVAGPSISIEDFSNLMIHRSGAFAGQLTTTEQKQALLNEMIHRELQVVRAREADYDSVHGF